jgi:hypothetical protein
MSINWIIVLIFLAFLLFGTSGPAAVSGPVIEIATVESQPEGTPVEISGNPGVILHANTYWGDFDNWTPAVEDLRAAEEAVTIAAPLDGRDPVLDGYRQYVGIIENGERKIVINSMCMEFDGWEENFIQIEDGGPCFWEALYNVETRELESLIVNGEA